ncbi:hypothetical protein AAVH_16181 [Aphelenchoides avenae]|nr:hypothetical protein AAVH_30234 [Aphelenchus avenae]KAH7716377.1 hypothetical protein AAVH_16181 [Aphelenchus avenae]
MKVLALLLTLLVIVAVAFGAPSKEKTHTRMRRQYLKAGLGGTKEAAVDPSKTNVYHGHGDSVGARGF